MTMKMRYAIKVGEKYYVVASPKKTIGTWTTDVEKATTWATYKAADDSMYIIKSWYANRMDQLGFSLMIHIVDLPISGLSQKN